MDIYGRNEMSTSAKLRLHERPVRLRLPAKVANDLGSIQGALAELAENMGHPGCASGCNPLHVHIESEFIVSESQGARAGSPSAGNPALGDRVDVFVPKSVTHDIQALQQAVAIAAERVGCAPCCSGFDILFRDEAEMIAISQKAIDKQMGV